MHACEPSGQAVACDDLAQDRGAARAVGHDPERPAERAGHQAGGLGHADHRHGRQLAQRAQADVERDADHHRIGAGAMPRHEIECRVLGHGHLGAGADDRRAERAGDRQDLGARCRDAARLGGDPLGDRGRGVGVDQQDSHRCSIFSRPAGI